MTKYVVPIDTPAAGVDWQAVVPGIYVYDVIGITATLSTGGGLVTVAGDSSGNGRNGTYVCDTPPPVFVPGLVPGGTALELDPPGPTYGATVQIPPTFNLGGGFQFTVMFWHQIAAPFGGLDVITQFRTGTPFDNFSIRLVGSAGAIQVRAGGHTADWLTVPGSYPDDGAAHFVAVTFDGVNLLVYVDGVAQAFSAVGNMPPAGVAVTNANIAGVAGSPSSQGIVDKFAVFFGALSSGDVNAILAAAASGVAAYNLEVLAFGPAEYYEFADSTVSTGRQPSLLVTDGTDDVLLIPTGFPAVSTPGPYAYAWQPGLNADTQSTDGTLTTVAIPRLILPAGYTVGTQTLDLAPTDQWSDVSLWWDDTYQKLTGGTYDYGFPPGRFYVYQRTGSQP